jgi:hypothetical protein
MRKYIFIVICLMLFGCATIQNYNKLEQSENQVLTTSIGSAIFRMNKSSDLPNVFGKADLYGGKVDKGYTELKLKGIKENGNLLLQVIDTNKSSTETTMDRYGAFDKPKVEVSSKNEINVGSAQDPDQTVFEFNPNKEKNIVISGVEVTFVEIKSYSVCYKLKKANDKNSSN